VTVLGVMFVGCVNVISVRVIFNFVCDRLKLLSCRTVRDLPRDRPNAVRDVRRAPSPDQFKLDVFEAAAQLLEFWREEKREGEHRCTDRQRRGRRLRRPGVSQTDKDRRDAYRADDQATHGHGPRSVAEVGSPRARCHGQKVWTCV